MELALCPWSFPNIHDLVGLGPTLHSEPQTSWGHLFSTKLYRALREAKFLQNYAGQFPDLLALLIKNILHPGGQSNDFCPGWYNSGLNSRAVIFSMPLSEELVQLVLKKPSTTNVLSLEIFTIILLLHTTKRKGYYSEFWEFFFIWSGYQSFITCMLWEDFPPICDLSSHSLNNIFWRMV